MTTTIFNPAQFAPESDSATGNEQQERGGNDKNKGCTSTGNSTRDQVRKLLFEIFSADDSDAQRVS